MGRTLIHGQQSRARNGKPTSEQNSPSLQERILQFGLYCLFNGFQLQYDNGIACAENKMGVARSGALCW